VRLKIVKQADGKRTAGADTAASAVLFPQRGMLR